MNHNNINDLQDISNLILKDVKKLCDDNNILYFLIEGTLLGAVRHQGFIPWDDDIDIGIPNDQLDFFTELAHKELPDYLYIDPALELKRINERTPDLTKVYHSKYEIEDLSGNRMDVNIDIISLIGMPKNRFARLWHYYIIMLYRILLRVCNTEIIGEDYWKNRKFFRRNVIKVIKKINFGKLLNYNTLKSNLKKRLNKYGFAESEYVMAYPSAYGVKEIFPKNFYGKGCIGKFNNMEMRLPSEYKFILSNLYGDYMTLPPEEKQVGTHYTVINDKTKQ